MQGEATSSLRKFALDSFVETNRGSKEMLPVPAIYPFDCKSEYWIVTLVNGINEEFPQRIELMILYVPSFIGGLVVTENAVDHISGSAITAVKSTPVQSRVIF